MNHRCAAWTGVTWPLAAMMLVVGGLGGLAGLGGCERAVGIGGVGQIDYSGEETWMFPQADVRDVDLLFMIDNSWSMAGEQVLLQTGFVSLIRELQNLPGGMPNVHIGVITPDLGTGMFQITYCEEVGGDGGRLISAPGDIGLGVPYIVDVEAVGCDIEKDEDGACLTHECTPQHCLHEPSTQLYVDSTSGCPRCKNYGTEDLSYVFGRLAEVGTMGCGFEQPLEALYKALDPATTTNAGFLREGSILSVVLVTDEDDCSGSNPQLYDNTQTDINSTLGPLTSYRCFEFGVTCDVNSRIHAGTRQNCVPREDAATLLHPVNRYVDRLLEVRPQRSLVVAAIAGPVTASLSGVGHDVVVGRDDASNPELQFSCTSSATPSDFSDGAVPAIRIHNVVAAFNTEADLATWAYTPVCSGDYSAPLQGIGSRIVQMLEFQCLPSPVSGCADPGVEFGAPQMAQRCEINSQCKAQCQVTDVLAHGLPQQERRAVPPCLEVGVDGASLPYNTDRTRAYAQAHPEERDPYLPVEACWHIRYEPACTGSRGAEILISRPSDPPAKTVAEVTCLAIPSHEMVCTDLKDDDQNCLIDQEDLCCLYPETCLD